MNESPENPKDPEKQKNEDVKEKSYRFSSENQPKNRRGISRKRKILKAIEDHGMDEPQFLRTVVANALEGDQKCMEYVLRLLFPNQKPMLPSFSLDVDKKLKPYQQLEVVRQAVTDGTIQVDIADAYAGLVLKELQAKQAGELEDRLLEVEKSLGLGNE